MMRVITNAAALSEFASGVFVPTMGALHDGHVRLVQVAAEHRDKRPVVVSIFVNPTQFNDPKDLERYPRTLDADIARCAAAGADVVFAPAVEVIYPPGSGGGGVNVPRLPAVATRPGLEDRVRPGHFAGVCQVVKRLFELVQPSAAFFGEKDWQQLQVIGAMTRQLSSSITGRQIEIVGVETIRDPDGLAMSSRNVFLSPSDRQAGLAIPAALTLGRGMLTVESAEYAMRQRLVQAGLDVQYSVIRRAETLEALTPAERRGDAGAVAGRALIAASVPGASGVRLIDNAPWGKWTPWGS